MTIATPVPSTLISGTILSGKLLLTALSRYGSGLSYEVLAQVEGLNACLHARATSRLRGSAGFRHTTDRAHAHHGTSPHPRVCLVQL